MTGAFPTPPIHDADPVPFHQLDPLRFERLLVDLLQEEDGVVLAEQHGRSGQADFGVDVVGMHEDGSCDLVSCKRYQEIEPRHLAAWSSEMLRHWADRWSGYRIRRFVLATTATNIASLRVFERIAPEMERFRKLGIRYELWGPTKLRGKLVPHRRLAAAYLKEHWADAICGPAEAPAVRIEGGRLMIDAGMVAQLGELQELLSGEVAARVEAALELLRQGRSDSVMIVVRDLRQEPRWSQLTSETQARVIRLEASAVLSEGDVAGAEALSAAADARHVADEPRLAARLAAERDGAEAGLALLGEPVSLAGWHLRSALLLAAGRRDEARDELERLRTEHPADAETLRLLALERLGSGRREEALSLIGDVEATAGGWLATRRSGVMIRYAAALSPSVGPEWTLVPNPLDADLVRRDGEAVALLSKALDLLDGMPSDLRSHDDDLWRLAVLAGIEGRRGQAVDLARDLLRRDPGDPMVVGWALTRGFELDLVASRTALERAYVDGAEPPQVRVLGMLLASADLHEDGADLLARHLDVQGEEQREEAVAWIARLRGEGMDRTSEILLQAQREGHWEPAEALLEELLAADPPKPFGLTVAELAASANRWQVLIRNIDRLVAFRSGTGLRIAVVAAMNARRLDDALGLLDRHGALFGPELPADMRRIRAEAWARSGRYDAAIREAAFLTSKGHADDALFEADMRARVGSVHQALPVVRRALKEGRLDSVTALQWSQRVRRADPVLARSLVRSAVAVGVDDANVLAAWNEAIELGLEAESAQLMPRVAARAESGDPSVRALSMDDALQFIRDMQAGEEHVRELYMSGAIPVHLYARGRTDVLLRSLRLNIPDEAAARALDPRLVRHGGRPLENGVSVPYGSWLLHLDVTALFEAERAGVLDRLEAHPNGITLSAHVPRILQEMQLSARRVEERRAPLERMMRLVADRIVEVREWLPPELTRVRMEDEDVPARPLRDLLGALSKAGVLRGEEAVSLAEAAELSAVPDLDLRAPLALTARAALRLATSPLLDRIAGSVPLVCDSASVERMRADLSGILEEEASAAAAASLAERVGDGTVAGTYRLLPLGSYDGETASPIERQLVDLLSLPQSADAVVWVEDRHLSGYATSGSAAIVGMTEVLDAMLASDDLPPQGHAALLRRYRASGAALLPFRSEEVVVPLLAAPIAGDLLVETPELVEIRRAFAATRTLEPHLKVGLVEGTLKDRPDEDLVARSTMRMFSEALQAVWGDGAHPVAECLVRSDWLLDAMRIRRLFRVPDTGEVAESRLLFEAMQIGHCLDKALDVGGLRDEHALHRINYLNWCWVRLVAPRAGSRPSIVDAVGDYLVRFYGSLLDESPFDARIDRQSYERLMFLRVQRLPPPVAARVRISGIFPRQVRVLTSVMLKSHRVESGRYWRGMREAARYGRASLRTDDGRRLLLRRTADGIAISGAARLRVSSDVALILAAPASERPAAVAGHLDRLDLSPEDRLRAEEQVAHERSLARIASALHDAEGWSVNEKRREVEASLQRRRGVALIHLEPPTPARLAWHHRLDEKNGSGATGAWNTLSAAVGIAAAFVRLAALPSSLPSGASLTSTELQEIVAAARTPMALAAAGRLLREADAAPARLADVVVRFVDAVERWGVAMTEILRFTEARMMADAAWTDVEHGLRLRLCWLHADWIVRVFAEHGFDPKGLSGSFPVHDERMDAIERLGRSPVGPADQAEPSTIAGEVLLVHGLAAMLGDTPANDLLPADLVSRICGFVAAPGAAEAAHASLLLRDPGRGDALGGFLTRLPAGVSPAIDDLVGLRDGLIDRALGRLVEDEADRAAWSELVALSSRGLDDARADSLAALADDVDLFAAAGMSGASPQPHVWRGVLGPLAWSGRPVEARVADLAARCARSFAGVVRPETPASAAVNELIGCCVDAARSGEGAFDRSLACRHLWTVANAWPACVPLLRRFVSRTLDGAAPVGCDAFWRLGNDLNRLP